MALLDYECGHPGWAKELTPAGHTVCRICNPKPNPWNVGFE